MPPVDRLQDVRSKIMLALIEAGVPVEVQHHEVATAGQAEIDFRFGTLVQTADRMMLYKYVVKNVCHSLGYTATFMPKPLFGDNGSGMHCHQSLWNGDQPLFFDEGGYALLSELARHYIGGLIAHAPALLALCAPTTNSYRRLVPGFEAPVNLMYSARNRSAICRIPMYSELAQGQAGGVPRAGSVGQPVPRVRGDADGGPRRHQAQARAACADRRGPLRAPRRAEDQHQDGARVLAESIDALEKDHDFLLEGDVFTPDVLETWISMKRTKDIAPSTCGRIRTSSSCTTTREAVGRSDGTACHPERSEGPYRHGRLTALRVTSCRPPGRLTALPPSRLTFPMTSPLRSSAITEGVQRAPNRAMLRAVGFEDGDFGKPIVGIANGYSTITPCNAGLDVLARRAESAVRAAGAMPQVFGTITVSDGISMGTEGMKYSLVSREVIADSIETACGAQSMDGVLAIGGCDKNMPGAMIAIARMNIPAIFVYGGTIKPGHYAGRDLTVVSVFEAVGSTARAGSTTASCWRSSATPARARAPAAGCSPPTRCRRRSRRWA